MRPTYIRDNSVASALALALCLAAACSQASSHHASPAPASAPYIKAVYSTPVTLDPAQMNDTASLIASNLLYDGLLAFDADLEIRGALAQSWSTSADGRLLSFELNSHARFHDGSPITAEDVVASLDRMIAPTSKVYSYYDCIEGAKDYHEGRARTVTGLRTISEHALEIRLKSPFPPFLSVLAGGTAKILPRNADQIPGYFQHPTGSGPFKYIGTKPTPGGVDTIFRRFDDYAGEKPKLSELVLRAIPEADAIREAEDGQIHDLANWPLTGQEDVFRVGQHIRAPVSATWIVGLNTRVAPFDLQETRQAFRDSLDTESFRRRFYPDALPAYGYIPPGLPGFQGYVLNNSARAKSAPASISRRLVQIAFPAGLARGKEMQSFLETSFRKKNWNVRVIEMPWDRLMKEYAAKTLQAFVVSMNMDYPDTEFLVRNFESGNPDNFSGVHDRQADDLIHEAREARDRVRRQELYKKLVARLHQLAPTIDLFHPRTHLWASSCVRGLRSNILADVYIDYKEVSLDPGCSTRREVAGR